MAEVDPADVTALAAGDLEQIVSVITIMAKAYTRGNGFSNGEPNDELAAVVTTAAARLAANGAQIAVDETAGVFSRSIRGGFTGWSLAEQFVLNRYRVRAQ
ncbi:hypothetical protein MNVM_02010 [Mycobacterium novum]|uniref:Uncharacterized protein n=1 Tax=Mycobacterium novum TaxID=2492438 RepID=A0A7I7JHB9_9MYCO|nr:hypothetical protein [Mycobacterium novum]BBX11120.1 hypothetical protein MNVM_02010 [Mycobacterium novum]